MSNVHRVTLRDKVLALAIIAVGLGIAAFIAWGVMSSGKHNPTDYCDTRNSLARVINDPRVMQFIPQSAENIRYILAPGFRACEFRCTVEESDFVEWASRLGASEEEIHKDFEDLPRPNYFSPQPSIEIIPRAREITVDSPDKLHRAMAFYAPDTKECIIVVLIDFEEP